MPSVCTVLILNRVQVGKKAVAVERRERHGPFSSFRAGSTLAAVQNALHAIWPGTEVYAHNKGCMPPAGMTGSGITTCHGRQTSTPLVLPSIGTRSTQSQPPPTPLTTATLPRRAAALGCCPGTCVRRRSHRGRLRQPGSPSQPQPGLGRPPAVELCLSLAPRLMDEVMSPGGTS